MLEDEPMATLILQLIVMPFFICAVILSIPIAISIYLHYELIWKKQHNIRQVK